MRPDIRNVASALAVAVLAGSPAFGADCVVADPTGTPLNVRAEPRGRIVSTLENGVAVRVTDEVSLSGKRWVRIIAGEETLGWVFAAYLDCAASSHTPKSAPMHPRTAPE